MNHTHGRKVALAALLNVEEINIETTYYGGVEFDYNKQHYAVVDKPINNGCYVRWLYIGELSGFYLYRENK